MNKDVISEKQGICLIILFVAGEALSMKTAVAAGSDLWLAIILAIAISLFISLAYSRLLSLFPNKNLFNIIEYLFGKFFGKIMCLLFLWYFFHTGSWVLRDFSEFPITISIPETPAIIPMLFMIFLSIWGIKEGIEVLGRWAVLFVILDGPLPSMFILFLLPMMDLNNIQPILYNGIESLIEGTFQAFSFPLAETVVFMMVLSSFKSKASYYRVFTKGLLIGGVLIAGVSLAEVLVLGPELYSFTFFPNHSVASKINIGNTIQRIEMIAIVAAITSTFIKVSIYLLAVCKGFAAIFDFNNYKFIVVPIGLLMCNLALFGEMGLNQLFRLVEEVWPYYAFPFQVILPILILVIAEIKIRKLKHKQPT